MEWHIFYVFTTKKVNFLTIGMFYGTDDLYDEILYGAVL